MPCQKKGQIAPKVELCLLSEMTLDANATETVTVAKAGRSISLLTTSTPRRSHSGRGEICCNWEMHRTRLRRVRCRSPRALGSDFVRHRLVCPCRHPGSSHLLQCICLRAHGCARWVLQSQHVAEGGQACNVQASNYIAVTQNYGRHLIVTLLQSSLRMSPFGNCFIRSFLGSAFPCQQQRESCLELHTHITRRSNETPSVLTAKLGERLIIPT